MKKKLSRFFTLSRRHDAGFTLVELIVVIAILAILAGVGTVGYSGYIKNANKNADKVLVGNIIRAIETGTNSTMFVNDDSFTKGATTYPVGVIVLSKENGCEVLATTSKIISADTKCVMGTITVVPKNAYTIESKTNDLGFIENLSESIQRELYSALGVDNLQKQTIAYNIDTTKLKTITYCTSHTLCADQRSVYTSIETKTVKKWWTSFQEKTFYTGAGETSYYFEEDFTGKNTLCTAENGHVEGGTVTRENIFATNETRVQAVSAGNPLYDAINAAFGSSSNMTLKYDGWGNVEDGGHSYATLLTYTDTMIGDIKGVADTLVSAANIIDVSSYLTEDYENAADMMDSFANHVTTKYDKKAWMTQWDGADEGNYKYYFGMNRTLDYCFAARIAYNTAFASYCSAYGIPDTYVEVIKDYYYTNKVDLPACVTTSVFADKSDATNDQTLYGQFVAAGDDGTYFDKCAKLFETYKDSEACTNNGEIFYDTMKTVAETGSEAYTSGSGGNDAYFDYYTNMMEEMAAYYDLLDEYDGNGIIILVTIEDGLVKCEVSPSTANPRND